MKAGRLKFLESNIRLYTTKNRQKKKNQASVKEIIKNKEKLTQAETTKKSFRESKK